MSATRAATLVAGSLATCVLLVLGHLFLGRSEIPASDIVRVLLGQPAHPAHEVVVLTYRLPRVLVGLGAGALLALSGVLAQAVIRNPLAEPATTGVGAGAALAVTASLLAWPAHQLAPLAATTGALATGVVLYAVGRRSFAVAGVLLGAVMSAATSLLLFLDSAPMAVVLRWLIGSLNARTPEDWTLLWPWLAALGPACWLLASRLNVWALGEPAAVGLGLRTGPFLLLVLLLAVLAAGAAVAATGAVAFVGLVAPHMGRLLVGGDHRLLIPLSAALGATLLSAADLVAFSLTVHLPGLATDVSGVPVGAVTALIGAPFLISLIRKEHHR